jgi:hypothetical protein
MTCSTCGYSLIGQTDVGDWGWPYRCFVCDPPRETDKLSPEFRDRVDRIRRDIASQQERLNTEAKIKSLSRWERLKLVFA